MSLLNNFRRGLAAVVLTLAAAALGAAFAFWRAGPDMVVMTLLFGGSGIYLIVEGLGLLILKPRRRRAKQQSATETPADDKRVDRAA